MQAEDVTKRYSLRLRNRLKDIRQNDIQYLAIWHITFKSNDIQRYETHHNPTQHNDTQQ